MRKFFQFLGLILTIAGVWLFVHSMCFDVCPPGAESLWYWPWVLGAGVSSFLIVRYLDQKDK
ncbi:hypothetical protein KW798_03875 [Candidatus Parcubacteria bacterium]|nr:hypothetical protein [Candidatus Parcubacteria bacterium]